VTRVLGRNASRILRAYFLGPNHPMKMRFWGLLMNLLGKPRLTIPYAGLGWITLDQDDWLQRLIVSGKPYEIEVWQALAEFADSCETVWDVGAHVGTFAVRALADSRIQEVHVFEPDPINAEILTYNLVLNQGCYRIHRFALGDCFGKVKLFHAELPNTGRSSLEERVGTREFEIESRTIDGLVFEEGVPSPTLLKIDVEGWECRVIQGGKRLLQERPPKALVIEGTSGPRGELTDHALREMLVGLGYAIRWIRRPTGEIQSRENYLAVRG
jgi:FkbM family methyltransferase